MTLADDIATWDLRSFAHIRRVYARHHTTPGFHRELLALCPSPEHADGATWLFKHALDEGDLTPEGTDPALAQALCEALGALTTWPAQLHALQTLSVLEIPGPSVPLVERFARACMGSPRAMVRAWSTTALYRASAHDPAARRRVTSELRALLGDPASPASVRARIRKTLPA